MSRHFLARFIFLLALLSSGVMSPAAKAAQSLAIAVLYPELQEPYRGVLASIIDGIREQSRMPVKLFSLAEGFNVSQLKEAIDRDKFSAIIALGRTGLAAAQQWRGQVPIVVGALILTPKDIEQGLSGISLAVDPEMLFERLDKLAPSIKRVHVVYNPEDSAWIIQEARSSARKRNFQLLPYKSDDIKSSALIYRDILNKAQPGDDAIWLLPDSVAVDDKLILPLLLKGAWDKSVLIFSSNPVHVKRGTLFALFPDNKRMGRSLAKMAEADSAGGAANVNNGIIPLADLQAAINVRTAEHVGLNLSEEERRSFALVFPAP